MYACSADSIEDVNHRFGRHHATADVCSDRDETVTACDFSKARRRVMRRDKLQGLAIPAIDIPNLASQMRTAFSSMVANTG